MEQKKQTETGFLIIKRSYPVICRACSWEGHANIGKGLVDTGEEDGADWCPVCGALALIGKEQYMREQQDPSTS